MVHSAAWLHLSPAGTHEAGRPRGPGPSQNPRSNRSAVRHVQPTDTARRVGGRHDMVWTEGQVFERRSDLCFSALSAQVDHVALEGTDVAFASNQSPSLWPSRRMIRDWCSQGYLNVSVTVGGGWQLTLQFTCSGATRCIGDVLKTWSVTQLWNSLQGQRKTRPSLGILI